MLDGDELTWGRSDNDIFSFVRFPLVLGSHIYDGGMQMTRILSTTEVSRTTGRRKRGPKGWLGPWGPVGGIAGEHGAFGSRGIVFQEHTLRFLWRTNIQDGVDHCFLLSVRSMKLLM